jgi:hypothetical protein
MARARHDDDEDDMPRRGRPRSPEEFGPRKPWAHEREEYWRRLQAILDALEIPDLGRDERLYLQGVLRRQDLLRSVDPKRFPDAGDGTVTLLLRTITESTNGEAGLTLPILQAVSSCMNPVWTDRGLEWIEAFDSVDLIGLRAKLADLGLEDQFERVIRGKLEGILGPPVLPKPKPTPRPKTGRPPNISEQTWAEYTAMRKRLKRPKAA